jgi:hypothetical protein
VRGSRVEGGMPDPKGHRKGSLEQVAFVGLGGAEDLVHMECATNGTVLWQILDFEKSLS